MDLETFITETLLAVAKGVLVAQQSKDKGGTKIVPASVFAEGKIQQLPPGNLLQTIEFDVAVTIGDGTTTGGKISVFSGILKAGGGAEIESQRTTAQRIKFSVPIALNATL